MTIYRKPVPYRKPRTYRGSDLVPAALPPGFGVSVRAGFGEGTPRSAATRSAWNDAAANESVQRLPYGLPTPRVAFSHLQWDPRVPATSPVRMGWDGITPRQDAVDAPWGQPAPRERDAALPWAETSQHLERDTGLPWRSPATHERRPSLPWGTLTPRGVALTALWRAAAARGAYFALPWGPAGKRERIYRPPWVVEPNPGDPGSDPITVPIQPVYMMIPTLSAVVLPARTPLDILSASISTDASSWAWRFQAQIPLASLPLVNPEGLEEPIEVEITVNGYAWSFGVESYGDNRRFGSKTATIQGKSRSAILAQPYAAPRSKLASADRNASQLADEELDGTGWTLLWDAVDWLVPGGTFSYADLAPIDAIGTLASAIGARVESHRSDLELAVKPMHATSPWAWDAATPYAILPAEIVTTFDGQWQGGPNANGIYVYSENAGFGALVRISGTGGEVQLPMVVDQLLVSADPAQERGRAELARSSQIKSERVTIPLFPSPASPGLLPIGALLEVTESATSTWRGQLQGIQITASRNGSAFSVRQNLEIERHFR